MVGMAIGWLGFVENNPPQIRGELHPQEDYIVVVFFLAVPQCGVSCTDVEMCIHFSIIVGFGFISVSKTNFLSGFGWFKPSNQCTFNF